MRFMERRNSRLVNPLVAFEKHVLHVGGSSSLTSSFLAAGFPVKVQVDKGKVSTPLIEPKLFQSCYSNIPFTFVGVVKPFEVQYMYNHIGKYAVNIPLFMYVHWVSLITGLLITGLDWTGILKFIFMLRGMQLKSTHFRVWLTSTLTSAALIACVSAEELVMQDILPLSCWVLTELTQTAQRGHRLQQVESET